MKSRRTRDSQSGAKVLREESGATKPGFKFRLLSCDSAITLLGRDPKESKIGVYTNACVCKFIAALATIDKRWKQLKRPPADKA